LLEYCCCLANTKRTRFSLEQVLPPGDLSADDYSPYQTIFSKISYWIH
jgi:hypothetical protein